MTPTDKQELRKTRRQAVALAVGEGMAISEACRAFGMSRSSVYEACKEHGTRGHVELSPSTWRVLADLLNTRDPVAVIAKRHGMSLRAVDQVRQRAKRAKIRIPARERAS